jgi:hypothetical protein
LLAATPGDSVVLVVGMGIFDLFYVVGMGIFDLVHVEEERVGRGFAGSRSH